jgi:hypothetical protein
MFSRVVLGAEYEFDLHFVIFDMFYQDFQTFTKIRKIAFLCINRVSCSMKTLLLLRWSLQGARSVLRLRSGLVSNTNKCESLWSHLKHKTKRIYGTSLKLTQSYVWEQLFRQNTREKEQTIIDAFLKRIRKNYPFDD